MADSTAQVRFFEARGLGEPAAPSLWVEIEGIAKPFAVMQYSSTFAKNEIPTATCVLGTGKSLSENTMVAVPEELVENLDGTVLTKAKVFLKFGPNSQWEPAGQKWPREPECIFEGYYAGVSYNRVGPQIQMSISLVHRLVDLTFGSLMSGWQHPSNPVNLLQPAVAPILGGADGDCHVPDAGGTGTWTVRSFLSDAVEDEAAEDFGEALLQTLLCMTSQDVFKLDCADDFLPEQPNIAAAEVFKAIKSKTGGLRAPLSDQSFLTPIGGWLGTLTDDSQGLTYWDYLIGKVFPEFVLAMIPLPSIKSSPDGAYAYIVPDTPGLNKSYTTLYLGDYTNFNLKARMWKPLYAVGVMSNGDNISGAECSANECLPLGGGLCIGGVFPAPGDLKKQVGQLLMVRQPNWLSGLNFTTGAMKDFGDTGKAAHDAVSGDEELPPPDKQPADLNEDRSNILDMYAKLVYVHNAINGRGGTFDTKLRFDISPGTVLKLDGRVSPSLVTQKNQYKELPGTVFVQVSRVTHNINAESPMAKTSFDCVHLRTEKENCEGQPKGKYSVEEHVFFTGEKSEAAPDGESYSGAPMIDKWKFKPTPGGCGPGLDAVLGDLDLGAVENIA